MVREYLRFIQRHEPAWTISQVFASISLKPTAVALVFLFTSGYVQQCLLKSEAAEFCSTTQRISIIALASRIPNQVIHLGSRTLEITTHASERMQERNVSIDGVGELVRSGQLFAYVDNGKVKMGYYDRNTGLFAAVDQRHKKLITVIRKTGLGYPERLMTREVIEKSRRL